MESFRNTRIGRSLGPPARTARTLLAVALVALGSASCDVHGLSEPGTLSSLDVTPDPTTLQIGTTRQFTATGADFAGVNVAVSPTWSVVNGGGTISPSGLFTAGTAVGTFASTVMATSGSLSATATVTVTAGPLATITVTPTPVTLSGGATQQYTAVGRDAAGNEVAITPTWSVINGGGAITAGGLFTAGSVAGTYANTVQASSGGIAATATVTVTPGPLATIVVTPNPVTLGAGDTQQFTATGRDASGNIVAITPVWAVVAGGGTIDATGNFTAGPTAGTYANTVRATSGTVSGTATVTVTTGPVTSIVVSPNPVTLNQGAQQLFTAVARDANNNIVAVTPTWAVVAGGGSINMTSGQFTAGTTSGTFNNTVRASVGAVAGFATVTVSPGPLATIVVTPNPVTLLEGNTQQFTATGRDAGGNTVAITPVWAVVAGGGTINPTGNFTAGTTAGTYANTVRATSGTVSGSATVTVTAPPPSPSILGTAASNGIMAGTAVTCVIGGTIFADVSISPGNTITGFPPCAITGVQNLANAVAAQMQIDLTAAYNNLAARPCPPANAITTDLGGTTKAAGVYCSATTIGVTGVLTLDGGGDPNAEFVFQAGTGLTTAGDIVLINGAQARNVWWLVGSSATIGTASQWQGNIVALTSITLVDNANLFGRALARNGAVSLGTGNTITLP